ncbi:hypothetical protein K388_00986 [Streptomyces sp. KhCrAH-43]|uniref:hypothetical protein n=1 Tax=unclassified Streptomyces TaxID=2593676 RepID=UPI000362EEED|nr:MULTISPECIES: hypothetical protein [unclassified Streptomyces]MYS38556.1 hypothetical protein [Streptomyces sp. SID4920]MYX66748.1 hypothetical protein [Streptomyces sp. SID8373]RAJ68242.1 hypothetical protein K388_00986 [Streptomyces sp. KhCrAH-43]
MNPFHGPPEWEQPAGRHTPLTDPVLTVRQISRFGFVPRRLTRIDHALVFATPSGRYTTALPPIRPTRAEIISRRYTAVYEVDMGVHPVRAELSLPSRNDALQFVSVVELSWQVGDPAVFVASRHRDVPRLLLGELEQAARTVARRFPITDSTEAEAEVLRTVRSRGPLGAQAGLLVTWTLRLHRDQDNIEHEQRMQRIGHEAVQRVHEERQAMAHDFEKLRRELARGEQQQALLLQEQKWRTELQDAELAKVDFYQRQLEQGGVRAWALHLAEHPEDSRLVMQSLRQDQLSMIRAKAEMVTQLLNSDNVEGYELEGPKNLALRALHDILNHQLPADETGRGAPAPRLPLSSEWPEEPEPPLPDVRVPEARHQPRTSPPTHEQDVYLPKDMP